MDATPQGLQVVATTEEGTRRALAEATRLANGSHVSVLLLVPHVVSFLEPAGNAAEAAEITAQYRALASDAGVNARVRLCVCRRLDDVFRWMLGPHAQVVIGGLHRWWWPTAAERIARRLTRQGHRVVFARSRTRISRTSPAASWTTSRRSARSRVG